MAEVQLIARALTADGRACLIVERLGDAFASGSDIDAIHPRGESGNFCKRLNFRAFRVFRGLHCRI